MKNYLTKLALPSTVAIATTLAISSAYAGSFSSVPESSSLALLALGIAGVGLSRRRLARK